jgi:hypothetical protein
MAVAFSVGLAVVAGPWIAVLTSHYGKLTFSTAGPANHANMGPTAFGNDPLWNPGLVAGFIVDPHFGPDWSAWQDGEHFLQQLKVIAYNLNNCLAFVVPWVVFGGIFAAAGMRRKNSPLRAPCEAMVAGEGGHHVPMVGVRAGSIGLWWCVVTVVLFCGGYSLINLESRYIVPVITPLLCLGAMLVAVNPPGPAGSRLDGMRRRWRKSAWWVAPVILLVSALDLSRLASIPLSHPQSARLARYRPVVEQLRLSGIEGKTFAANRWHDGLYVSYAAGNVPNYLGTPLRNTATSLIDQLRQSKAAVYLRWHRLDDPAETDKMADAPPDPLEEFVPAAPWRLAATIPDSGPEPGVVEIWMRD